jgi:hypothetical protein
MRNIAMLTAAVACACALTACGGGGDNTVASNSSGSSDTTNTGSGSSTDSSGNGSTGSSSSTGSSTATGNDSNTDTGNSGSAGSSSNTGSENSNNTETAGSTISIQYEALASAPNPNNFLALLNQEGAKGYRCFSSDSFLYNGSGPTVFVNDGVAPTYNYELLIDPINLETYDDSHPYDFLNQINEEGAKGYRFEGWFSFASSTISTFYALYRKDGGSSATYTYTADVVPGSDDDSLAQANEYGQSGYLFLATISPQHKVSDIGLQNLYMKNNVSGATYTYEALPSPSTDDDFVAQANSEGAKGYRSLGGDWFVKDQSQSSTFTYQAYPDGAAQTLASLVDIYNNLGAQGYEYILPLYNSSPKSPSSLYFKANNCSGFLCVYNPLTQVKIQPF